MSRLTIRRYLVILVCILISKLMIAQHFQDCDQSFPICNKQTYHFKSMDGIGHKQDALGSLRCSKELRETNALWMTWKVEQSGIITFFIDPAQAGDDIDFVLFRSSGDCNVLEEVRCMASGENMGQAEARSAGCKGQTGLSYQSIDDFESTGCKYDSDNFLKFLSAEAGEQYYLFVNNYNSKEGFSISFDGDAEFRVLGDCELFNVAQPVEISSIVPNPTTRNITVNFLSLTDQEIKTEIFSIEGKRLHKSTFKTDKGMNKQNIDVEQYAPGTYLIRLTQDKYSTIRQFVKI